MTPRQQPSVDLASSNRSTVVVRGFPRASGPVHEWVPGVSTPEGLLLSSAAAAAMLGMLEPNVFERAVQAGATVMMVTVSSAIPAGAVFFGVNLFHH